MSADDPHKTLNLQGKSAQQNVSGIVRIGGADAMRAATFPTR
jgi:hypothetical protein